MRLPDSNVPEQVEAQDAPGPEARPHAAAPLLRAARAGLFEGLRTRVKAAMPPQVRRLLRRARTEAKAALLDLVPLPAFEVWKLRSLDPFVARAATLSHRTSGCHVLVLAGLPMGETGGGHRSAELALEMLARGHRVTYVYRLPARERGRRRRSFAHENLTHIRFSDFSARRFSLERGMRERIVVVCTQPLPEYRACVRYLRARGAQTVYDCAEDWESALSGRWYLRRTEDRLLKESDLVVASARALKDALESRSWRDVALLPNAVNTRLFARGRELARPLDMPRGQPVLLYVGPLWADWFEWEWVAELARARPGASVVLVGEHHGQSRSLPPNVHLLGLRPLAEVPAYIAHADVCLLPIKTERAGWAFSPLEVFEYVAMGKPVVATALPELEDLPNVLLARSPQEFAQDVFRAQGLKPSAEHLTRFVAENSWKARVRQLERLLGM